jgi:GTP 3',8-cyclase
MTAFIDAWRRQKSAAFDLQANSTARQIRRVSLWGQDLALYANANLSIYSAERCNAACPFCVEELRPASRGVELRSQKAIERDDDRYFGRLSETLSAIPSGVTSVSITGGEPSKDPRLPRLLMAIEGQDERRRTMTTNGSGLFDRRDGQTVIDWVMQSALDHLNLSVAHPRQPMNARLMRLPDALTHEQLQTVARQAASASVRVRLSCVLLRAGVHSLDDVLSYLRFAQALGIDNVIFRQLMLTDPQTHRPNHVVEYSDRQRVALEPLLDELSLHPAFSFVRQVMGYYYYVEVWRWQNVDVVFEEADLAQLEAMKRRHPKLVHELVFHPSGDLASTWQPWDGVLGPPGSGPHKLGTSIMAASS